MKSLQIFGTTSLLVAGALSPAFGQATSQGSTAPKMSQSGQATSDPAAPSMNPDNSGSYATGKPLEMQSKEGFWGHVNPFARKKWVHRQIDPIKDRTNELDQLQSKNANDIRDVDGRATAGIGKAMTAASAADAHATDAAGRADKANSLAMSADGKTNSLNGTVSNLDQYQKVSSMTLPFLKGRTALTTKAKANLDEVATSLASEKGYIVEVQGYSRGGVTSSQAMADSVVRYLVTAHQIPIYRIYRTGLGHQKAVANQKDVAANDAEKPLSNGVRVTVLHNSLASMNSSASSSTTTPETPKSTPNTAAPVAN